MRIPGLRWLSPVRLIKYAVLRFREHDMATYAAAVTYHVSFSLFPFIIFFIALLGFLHLPNFFDWLRQQAQAFFLQQTMHQINQIFDQLQQRRMGILSVGAIVALWAASSGMRAVVNALNVVYGVKESRPMWKRYPLSLLYTLGIGVLLAIAITLVLGSPHAMQVARQVGISQAFATLWAWWLRWPAVVVLLTLTVAAVYGLAPDVEQRFRFVSPGAFLAVVVWIATSLAFNYYVRTVVDYNVLYGSVGTIIVLLLYFFISSLVLLFGAEINAVVEHHAATGKDIGDRKLK
ncbi:YihY/virulence factor BrkB family protein [Undibacterium arcticum]|uniref:YihY/virulence factor BrkB family protein n=1 Tax=Undibacterium arcticum TaxID=1762892 RepID=A0ABV7EXT5_9BURK